MQVRDADVSQLRQEAADADDLRVQKKLEAKQLSDSLEVNPKDACLLLKCLLNPQLTALNPASLRFSLSLLPPSVSGGLQRTKSLAIDPKHKSKSWGSTVNPDPKP